GSDGDLRSRPDRSRTPKPDQQIPDLDLPPRHQGRVAGENTCRTARARRARGDALACAPARHRVHAKPQRGHAPLHAYDLARHLGHQRGGSDADPGQDHQVVPEVASVYGKVGRASTSTDPAPTEMFETVVNLKPKEQWRPGLSIDGLIAE